MEKRIMKIKKITSLVLVGAMAFAFCACGNANDSKKSENGENTSVTQIETKSNEFTEDILKGLVKENLHCMLDIFELKALKHEEVAKEGTTFCLVDSTEFKDYADFENYVRSVYCKTEADRLLTSFPLEGKPKYVNVDGKLYFDTARMTGKGYYVNWDNYTFTIDSKTEDKCEFTLKAKETIIGEQNTKVDYEVKVTAILENGKWVLTKMFH